jgi:hypothetical protein
MSHFIIYWTLRRYLYPFPSSLTHFLEFNILDHISSHSIWSIWVGRDSIMGLQEHPTFVLNAHSISQSDYPIALFIVFLIRAMYCVLWSSHFMIWSMHIFKFQIDLYNNGPYFPNFPTKQSQAPTNERGYTYIKIPNWGKQVSLICGDFAVLVLPITNLV